MKFKMGTRIHGNMSHEQFTTFLGRTMRSGQESLCNFAIFLSKFGCQGNSLWLWPRKIYVVSMSTMMTDRAMVTGYH